MFFRRLRGQADHGKTCAPFAARLSAEACAVKALKADFPKLNALIGRCVILIENKPNEGKGATHEQHCLGIWP